MPNIALEVVVGLVFAFWVLSLAAAGITEAIAVLTAKRSADLTRGLAAMLGGPGPALWVRRLARRVPLLPGIVTWWRQATERKGAEREAAGGEVAERKAAGGEVAEGEDPEDDGLVGQILAHPLIAALGPPRLGEKPSTAGSPPSYIPSATFARVLLDVLGAGVTVTKEERDKAVAKLKGPAKAQLEAVLAEAGDDIASVRTAIEGWFDDQMDRVSGWYKRWAKKVAFVAGLGLVVALNADAITMTTTLWREPSVRAALVAQADAACPEPAEGDEAAAEADCTVAVDKLEEAGLPLGWDCPDEKGDRDWRHCIDGGGEKLHRVVGWLITAGAISLGAPFWFETLGKLSPLRSTGRKPERDEGD